jgi:protein-tyrosine phosphatase
LVDIHSHVLFDLDDGPRTSQESVAMLRMAAEHGTTDLVATPHADLTYRFEPDRIAARMASLEAALPETLRLYSGCDFHLSYDNIEDAIAHPRKYTIAQKNYLLVEFSDMLIFKNTAEIFGRLQDAGMIPVITHPERNALLRQRIKEIAEWVEQGARVQVTGQSLTGAFGSRACTFSKVLLDHQLVHVIASDGHDCERRPPVLDEAYAWLTANYGGAVAKILCADNPRATLTGAPMRIPERDASVSGRKWYQLWR